MSLPRVFTIEPNPHWVIIDNFSRLPMGAAIYTYRQKNFDDFKPAFQDAAGLIPYGQPIIGFGNGTMPPIYWEFDPNNPDETYYIRVYDKENVAGSNAQFLWDFQGLSGGTGGGSGGGTIVVTQDVENLVVNNVFFRNIGTQAGTPSLPLTLTLAPSAHQGFVNDATNPSVIANGPVSPDLIFAKSNQLSTDSLSFPLFGPLGIHALPGPDVTPERYLEYSCTVGVSGETYKYIQFPVSQGIQNLSASPVALRFYGRCTSGAQDIVVRLRQFYGSGGSPSVDKFVDMGTVTLTPAWTATTLTATAPDATGATIGTAGNDGLFLQFQFKLDTATTINITKPQLYLGNQTSIIMYDSNDEIDSMINTPRTGDIRTSINNFQPYGWVAMNDGTIANGNPAIVAPASGFARNNVDTFPLYDLLWNLPNSVVPAYDSAGNALPGTGRGASSVDDFTAPANRQLALTKAAGRVFAGISTTPPHALGTFLGEETHLQTTAEVGIHTHPPVNGTNFVVSGGGGTFQIGGGAGVNEAASTGANAGGTPFNIMQPTTYMHFFIKL